MNRRIAQRFRGRYCWHSIICKDIAETLQSKSTKQKMENGQMLLKILSNIRFLARQSIAIRGDGDEDRGGGELPDVGYMGMCHWPGSIFDLQKSRTGPKFLKFYSRTGPNFWSFTPEQDPFLTIWSPTPWLKCQKSQLLSSFVSCSLMSSFLFCKVFQAFYNWDQFESGHMYSSLNLTWFHQCG